MFVPIRGRFRVCKDGYEWTGVGSANARICERTIPPWQTAPATANMAVEIANISLEESAGIERFVVQWGLPVIKDGRKLASMTLAEFRELVHNVRDVVTLAIQRDQARFKILFGKHAFFAARPRSDPNGKML
jgi:hypothetical protein